MLKKYIMRIVTEFIWLRIENSGGRAFEHGNVTSGYQKQGIFIQ
jgi:hypothetical protein